MIKIILLFLLPLTLFGSKILSYNIYDRTDRVDVMITFDTPYDGAIKKSESDSKIIIKLQDTSIESSKMKKLTSEYINALSISPMNSYVQVVASVPSNVKLIASKTSDAYGLRLRFVKSTLPSKQTEAQTKTIPLKSKNPLSVLPTKKDEDISQSYYIVIGILIVGIILLFILKKKVTPTPSTSNTNSNWMLSKQNKTKQTPSITNPDVSIRFQKALDENNSVVMLDFAQQSYLVMMGNNNVLLDRFTDNKPTSQEDFESILQERHQALEEFLDTPTTEPMEAYRNKASSISYEV